MNTVRIIAGAFVGAGFWMMYRHVHKHSENEKAYYCLVTVPSWLAWAFGRPLPDNQLDLAALIGQIGSLISIAVWLSMGLLDFNEHQQIRTYGSIYFATLVVVFSVRVGTRIVNMLTGRDGDSFGD